MESLLTAAVPELADPEFRARQLPAMQAYSNDFCGPRSSLQRRSSPRMLHIDVLASRRLLRFSRLCRLTAMLVLNSLDATRLWSASKDSSWLFQRKKDRQPLTLACLHVPKLVMFRDARARERAVGARL